MSKTHTITTSHPPDRAAIYREAARAAGLTLSEWVGRICDSQLPRDARKQLLKRHPRGPRPKHAPAE
jgi:hypothetical protein